MKKLFYIFNHLFDKASSNKIENNYKRITTNLPEKQVVSINSIEGYGTNYLVKCNLY